MKTKPSKSKCEFEHKFGSTALDTEIVQVEDDENRHAVRAFIRNLCLSCGEAWYTRINAK